MNQVNMEPAEPKFEWGQRVLAICDLFNDGSYPEREPGELLAGAGTCGEIVRVGAHQESKKVIYLVEFSPDLVVGCLEEELAPA